MFAVPTPALAEHGSHTAEEGRPVAPDPLSYAVDGSRVLVADARSALVGKLRADGTIQPIVAGVPGLSGLATRDGWMAYGSSIHAGSVSSGPGPASGLNIRDRDGAVRYVDLYAFERATNPDGAVTYGVTDPTSGARYRGRVGSLAHVVASRPGGWLVADAGANSVLMVTDSGEISTLAVLPSSRWC